MDEMGILRSSRQVIRGERDWQMGYPPFHELKNLGN